MSRRKRQVWSEDIESILQRIKRQSSTTRVNELPPDDASAAIGRGLATRFMEGLATREEPNIVLHATADKIVACLSQEQQVSPSLPEAFFSSLEPNAVLLAWIPQWISETEERYKNGGSICTWETLTCLIRTHARFCSSLKQSESTIADTYLQLKSNASRTCMVRDFIQCAFESSNQARMILLMPLMASCVIRLSTPLEEKMLFLSRLWREVWVLVRRNDETVVDLLAWQTQALHIFVIGASSDSNQEASMELAYQWFMELVDMAVAVSSMNAKSNDAIIRTEVFVPTMLDKILPHFFRPPCRFTMEPILTQLVKVVKHTSIELDRSTWFRLAALALSTPSRADIVGLLTLIVDLPPVNDDIVRGLCYSLACMFGQAEDCQIVVKQLHAMAATDSTIRRDNKPIPLSTDLTSIVQLFHQTDGNEKDLLEFMMDSLNGKVQSSVSVIDQNTILLIGCSLLHRKGDDIDLVKAYLKALLDHFPHLGIKLLPILLQFIQSACDVGDGKVLLAQLEFLCDAVVKDPHCAQEVWNLVGVTMIQTDSPTSVRSAAVRMYPRLCASNKRLYRRIIDTMGCIVDSAEPELRLAVMTTINDLASEDRIRDVSDVIGWVQTYLSDENPSVVHFAISCLHHLVAAQELDFDLVIKVLNKKLCPVDDIDRLFTLPGTVLSALALLLGDGECDIDDNEYDEGDDPRSQDVVSPQILMSVNTLIQLATSPALCLPRSSAEGLSTENMISHIRLNIFKSLSNYSLPALELDFVGVRSATIDQQDSDGGASPGISDTGKRYLALKQLLSEFISHPSAHLDESTSDPVISLIRKLLVLEEEALGSSLWQKRGKHSTATKTVAARAPKSAYSSLPSPSFIEKSYNDSPRLSTAVASLLCYSGRTVDELFDFAGDVAGGSGGPYDLLAFVFNLQGWVHAMHVIWADIEASNDILSKVEHIEKEISGWKDTFGSIDMSCLALAVLTMFMLDTATEKSSVVDVNLSSIAERVRDDIWLAYEDYQFENLDTADLCIGIMGVRAIHSRFDSFVEKSISALERRLHEQAGRVCVGACYGLALIAQIASLASTSDETTASSSVQTLRSWINRISALLVNELQLCFDDFKSGFVTLVACLKTGMASPDQLHSLSKSTGEIHISEANAPKVRCLLLSLGLCARAIGSINAKLLLCLHKLIDKLPWGSGKGFALPNAALQSVSAGVLQRGEMECLVSEQERDAQSLMEAGNTRGFQDALHSFVVTRRYLDASSKETASEGRFSLFHRAIVGGDAQFARAEGWSALMLTATVFVSSFPCLGVGGHVFCSVPILHPQARKDEVSQVVKLLTEMAESSEWNRVTDTAMPLVGLLASLKEDPATLSTCSIFDKTQSSSETDHDLKSNQVKVERLPIPCEGTMLEAVMNLVDQASKQTKDQRHMTSLTRVLSCLETLSLPSQFSRSLIEPMLGSDICEWKQACVSLLVSQVNSRRRAAFDGRDFVKLVSQLALLSPTLFEAKVGSGSAVFLSSIQAFLPRMPSDSVKDVLLSLWKTCEFELERNASVSCTVGYLQSLSTLLDEGGKKSNSARLSPKTRNTIIQVLLQRVFTTLCLNIVFPGAIELGSDVLMTEDAFLRCITKLDLSVLETHGFFDLEADRKIDSARAFWIVDLVNANYFEQEARASKELMRVSAWFAHQAAAPGDVNCEVLRKLAVRLAAAAKTEDAGNKNDIVSVMLEALHVRGPETMCLELLGMLTSVWADGATCDPESSSIGVFFGTKHASILRPQLLANLSMLLQHDLPFNFGVYSHVVKAKGLISNRVGRIHKTWLADGETRRDLRTLEGILANCRSPATDEEYAAIAMSSLAETDLLLAATIKE